jgi:hypothetical protein
MPQPPTKPNVKGNAEAVAWNKHVASELETKVAAITAALEELAAGPGAFVTGGPSVEWELAWSDARFASRMLRAWELNREVSRREIEARFAPPPPTVNLSPPEAL